MSGLFDLFTRAKKKVEDWIQPEIQTVSRGLSGIAQRAGSIIHGAENVGRNVGNFLQENPTPQAYVQKQIVPEIKQHVFQPIQRNIVQPTVTFAKNQWDNSMFNPDPNSSAGKRGAQYRSTIPQITPQEARKQISQIKMPENNNDTNFGDMPIIQAVKQRSIKPIYQQFTTPEGRKKLVENMGHIDPMNTMGMGEVAPVGKVTGRVINNAIKKGVSSEGVQSIIKVGEQKFAPVARNSANKVARAARGMADDFMEEVGALKKPATTFEEKIAEKNSNAKNLINKQLENQRQDLQIAEDGFVPPSKIKTPQSAPQALEKEVDDVPFKGDEFAKEFKPLKEVIAEKNQKSLFPENTETPFNKYQQAAYDKKVERSQAVQSVINYPTKLRQIGYKKAEIDRIGQGEAEKILKLSDLGYPKNEIQTLKYDNNKLDAIIEKSVPYSSWKDYTTKMKALKTNFLDGIDPATLKDINPIMSGNRDIYRNTQAVFGENYPKIKSALLDPFDQAKGDHIDYQTHWLEDLHNNVVKKFGIEKNSPMDKAVVSYGENKLLRPLEELDLSDVIKKQINLDELKALAEKTNSDWRTLAAKKLEEMPNERRQVVTQQLQQTFPDKWQNVIEAEKWFRPAYDNILERTNSVYNEVYPTNPLFPEYSKIIPKRNDYFRHGKEFADGFEGIKNLFETPFNIDPSLAATSEFTEPKSKFLSIAQQRKGDANEFGAVGGFLDYLKASSYAQHIDPFIQKFRGVDAEAEKAAQKTGEYLHKTDGLMEELSKKVDPVHQMTESVDASKIKNILMDHNVSDSQAEWMSKELSNITDYGKVKDFLKNKLAKNSDNPFGKMVPKAAAEESGNKLNNYLRSLTLFANDLAGKTNSFFDRTIQDNIGRAAMNGINMANKRIKANSIGFNLSSSLSQGVNIAQGFADAGPINAAKGIKDSLASIFDKNSPINKSTFVKERFFDDYSKFDTGILNNTKKFGFWVVGALDEAGTKLIWHSEYNKALADGVKNAVKFADDQTRKMVAGRGIGEMPVNQKAKSMQLIAPFQLEVQNLWHVFHDWKVEKKLIPKLIQYSVYAYLYNEVKQGIAGSRVTMDPINAGKEAIKLYNEEENKGKGAVMAGGRLIGEGLKNFPGGGLIASTAFSPETSKKYLGDADPNRYGGGAGLILGSGMLKGDILTADGIKKTFIDMGTKLALPSGGRQIQKTYEGAKALLNKSAENSSGNVMTPVKQTPGNVAKGLMFGKNALNEVKDYYEKDMQPLSKNQSEKFKLLGNDYYNEVSADRTSKKEIKALKEGGVPGESKLLSDGVYQLSNGKIYVKSLKKQFNNIDNAKLEIAKDEFRKSDKSSLEYGGKIFRKSANGKVTSLSKDVYQSEIYTEQLSSYKKNKNTSAWKEVADKQFESLNNQLKDPNIDELEKIKIQKKIDSLVAEYSKVKSYGGFTKGKKAVFKSSKNPYTFNPTQKHFAKLSVSPSAIMTSMPQRYKVTLGKSAQPKKIRSKKIAIKFGSKSI